MNWMSLQSRYTIRKALLDGEAVLSACQTSDLGSVIPYASQKWVLNTYSCRNTVGEGKLP